MYEIDGSSAANTVTFNITGLNSTTDYIWISTDGNTTMDPLELMKQDFEALANLFFQEKFDRSFEDYRCPPAFDLQ